MAESRPADIELQMTLEGDDFTGNIDIVHLTKLPDPHAVGIPDLGVDCAGLVLQGQCLVCLSRARDQRLSLFAQINFLYTASVLQFVNIVHLYCSLSKISIVL